MSRLDEIALTLPVTYVVYNFGDHFECRALTVDIKAVAPTSEAAQDACAAIILAHQARCTLHTLMPAPGVHWDAYLRYRSGERRTRVERAWANLKPRWWPW